MRRKAFLFIKQRRIKQAEWGVAVWIILLFLWLMMKHYKNYTRALLAQGWEIEMYVSRGYFKSLYIREPGGNRVEFATLTPGFTLMSLWNI